jgi:hypothetical protein
MAPRRTIGYQDGHKEKAMEDMTLFNRSCMANLRLIQIHSKPGMISLLST